MSVAIADENLRVRVSDASLKDKWERVLDEHNLTTQRALLALMEWIVNEDPLTRAMIFKLVPKTERATLSRLVLERLATSAKSKRTG